MAYQKKTPLIRESKKFVAFDCDDTLVMWNEVPFQDEIDLYGTIPFQDPYKNKMIHNLRPHKKHIQKLKGYAQSGWTVMVWSAGGWEWAKTVVETLGLQDYVDLIMSKPDVCYDDMPVGEGIAIRKYYLDKKLKEES